jgi:hypothetical protein
MYHFNLGGQAQQARGGGGVSTLYPPHINKRKNKKKIKKKELGIPIY